MTQRKAKVKSPSGFFPKKLCRTPVYGGSGRGRGEERKIEEKRGDGLRIPEERGILSKTEVLP